MDALLTPSPCSDCVIWIGKAYPTIRSFVDEARRRGCSRQVPFWPAWAKAGVTRVFLAHRGTRAGRESGVVFGYFILHGVDVVATQKQCDEYKGLHKAEKPVPLLQFWEKRLPHQLPVRSGRSADEIRDFILDLIISCEGRVPRPHGRGYVISTDQTVFEEERLCGMRLGPEREKTKGRPSLYFVDAVEREIAEEFCDLLKKLKPPRPEPKKKVPPVPDFRTIVDRVSGKATTHTVDPIVDGVAHGEGALTVFDKPYPFHRSPAAHFRGLLRVDGDELLRLVARYAAGKQRVDDRFVLPYCQDETVIPGHSRTKSQLGTRMAHDLRMNVANAHHIFDWLSKTIRSELSRAGIIRLTDVGTLRVQHKSGRRQVELEPSSVLLGHLGCVASHGRHTASGRSITESQLGRRMAQDLRMDFATTHRIFVWLAENIRRELSGPGVIRLNGIGTLRVQSRRGQRLVEFEASSLL